MKSERRERGGLVELPKPPRLTPRATRSGSRSGPFQHRLALHAGQAPQRTAWRLLLQLLGGRTRTELPASAVEAVS